MQLDILGNPDYGELSIDLEPGEKLHVESGAMSRMSPGLELRTHLMGGILPGLARKIFGGESFFVGEYGGPQGGHLSLSPGLPGTVLHEHLEDSELVLTAGSFLACTSGIELKTRFGGLRALFSGEGAFVLRARGTGELFFNAYGAVIEKEINGSLRVDTGHVVAFEDALEYSVSKAGGSWIQSFLSGEGIVLKFLGRGRLYVQSHNPNEFGKELGPRLPERSR